MARYLRDYRNMFMPSPEYCNGKPIYDKKGAQTAKNRRMKHAHVELRAYQCPDCNMWHLTSQLRKEPKHKNQ